MKSETQWISMCSICIAQKQKLFFGFQKFHPAILLSHNSWQINKTPHYPQEKRYQLFVPLMTNMFNNNNT